jgi:hypothetical protein
MLVIRVWQGPTSKPFEVERTVSWNAAGVAKASQAGKIPVNTGHTIPPLDTDCSLAVVPKWYLTVCRLDMLRVLVEASGNARTSNYPNYWSGHKSSVFKRSPLH